jgi:hypothetical protein
MPRSTRLAPVLILLTMLAGSSLAADLTIAHDGDRVTGEFPERLSEAGFVLDAIVGTELSVNVRSADGKAIWPEVLLYDPEGFEIPLGVFASSKKVRLRRLVLSATGRYVLIVRAGTENAGRYGMKLRAKHPGTYRGEGSVGAGNVGTHLRFSGFAGSVARFKVRGRDGLRPDVTTMLLPDVSTMAVASTAVGETTVRGKGIEIVGLGDFRLVVEGRDGTTGRWKGKVRLDHPETERRSLVVDGHPAGTFTDRGGARPVPPLPDLPPPQGPLPWRLISGGVESMVTTQRTMWAVTGPDYAKILNLVTPWLDTFESPAYRVDFTSETVIAIFLGARSDWNSGVLVESIDREGYYIVVKWIEGIPGANCTPIPVSVQPWVLVAVRADGPVRFEKRTMVIPCPVLDSE